MPAQAFPVRGRSVVRHGAVGVVGPVRIGHPATPFLGREGSSPYDVAAGASPHRRGEVGP